MFLENDSCSKEKFIKSPFFKLLDSNDSLDIRDDVTIEVINNEENPNYISPNWREQIEIDSWLNEKFCKYQVVVPTNITSLLSPEFTDPDEYVESISESYREAAVEELLTNFNKEYSETSFDAINNVIELQKYNVTLS